MTMSAVTPIILINFKQAVGDVQLSSWAHLSA